MPSTITSREDLRVALTEAVELADSDAIEAVCNLINAVSDFLDIDPKSMMTRERAQAILARREGTPPEHLEHCRDDDLIRAANAPAGQPCADCGGLVIYGDDNGWTHVDPEASCFLAR
jgi:hypothetical protein